MAKKNGSTSKGLSPVAEKFVDQVRSGAQPLRELILLDFKPYDILDDLERLRAMVESGEINGLMFAAKYTKPGKQRHFFGASGRCAENIDEALGVATQLQMDLARQAAK
ncbi:hypothetical protein [Thiobacillus sp.]